jgi:hypothetical protein
MSEVEDLVKMQRTIAGKQALFPGDVPVVDSEDSIDRHVESGLLEDFPHGAGFCRFAELHAPSGERP